MTWDQIKQSRGSGGGFSSSRKARTWDEIAASRGRTPSTKKTTFINLATPTTDPLAGARARHKSGASENQPDILQKIGNTISNNLKKQAISSKSTAAKASKYSDIANKERLLKQQGDNVAKAISIRSVADQNLSTQGTYGVPLEVRRKFIESEHQLLKVNFVESEHKSLKNVPILSTSEAIYTRAKYLAMPDVKLTDSEIKEAKELLKLQGFIRPKDFSTDLLYNASGPDSKLAILNNLSKKISPMESFAEWTLKPVINLTTNMGGLINKDTAKNVKKTYDLSFQAMKTQHPIASTAGEMAGEALKYYTGSKIVSAIPGIGKATAAAGKGISALSKGKIGVDLATRVAAGQAATLPVETANAISEGIQNKKSATDIGVDILKRQAMNLGFDVGTEATGKLLTLGAKKIAPAIEKARAGKALDKADIGLINDTAKQVSDGSITSKVKKVIADLSRFKDTDLSDFNTARKSYIEYAQKNFPKSVVNAETNMHIDIPRQGLEKLLSGKISTEKYASAFHVPELIENAKKVGEAPYLKSKENIFKYDYFDSPIAINEKEYMAHIRVRETNMGNKYYGHTLSGVIDDIKIEPSARSYVDESTLHPVNALGSNNSISQTNKNINREIPIETANAISENVQNNSGSWKDRSYTQNEKTYVQSEDGLRMYEVPKQNEINYHVEKDGTVSLNEDVISHLDQRDYRDFIKTYAEKNLITKIDPRTGEMIDAKPIIINSTGDDIIITQTGINEVMKKMRGAGLKSRDNVASMLLLNKIIQQANMNHSELNRKGRINPHTYYDSRFAIDGRQYHVKLDIKNVPAGDRYYYHSLENIEIGSSNGSNGLNP